MKTPCKYQTITPETRQFVYERDNYTCQECGKKGKPGYKSDCIQAHHITPSRFGGSNLADNLITLCVKCHKKHDRENWVASMQEWQKRHNFKNITQS